MPEIHLERRTALKTVGASIVGGTILTGTAVATWADVTGGTINLVETDTYHDFSPDKAAVDSSELPATVTWHNKDVEHNVALVTANGERLFSSQGLRNGENWEVRFESTKSGYKLIQTNAYGNASGPKSATVSSGGLPLTMKCDIHDAPISGADMKGELNITDL